MKKILCKEEKSNGQVCRAKIGKQFLSTGKCGKHQNNTNKPATTKDKLVNKTEQPELSKEFLNKKISSYDENAEFINPIFGKSSPYNELKKIKEIFTTKINFPGAKTIKKVISIAEKENWNVNQSLQAAATAISTHGYIDCEIENFDFDFPIEENDAFMTAEFFKQLTGKESAQIFKENSYTPEYVDDPRSPYSFIHYVNIALFNDFPRYISEQDADKLEKEWLEEANKRGDYDPEKSQYAPYYRLNAYARDAITAKIENS